MQSDGKSGAVWAVGVPCPVSTCLSPNTVAPRRCYTAHIPAAGIRHRWRFPLGWLQGTGVTTMISQDPCHGIVVWFPWLQRFPAGALLGGGYWDVLVLWGPIGNKDLLAKMPLGGLAGGQ